MITRLYRLWKHDRATMKIARAGKYLLTHQPDDVEANVFMLNLLGRMLYERVAVWHS